MKIIFLTRPKYLLKLGIFLSGLAGLALYSGCSPEDDYPSFENVGTVHGFRPVYVPLSEAEEIKTLPPRTPESPGKIYLYGDYLFINEIGQGVHLYDNSDPANPKALSFLKITGNVDIAIKEDILYADNAGDLVALDISDIADVKIKKRIKGVYSSQLAFPAERGRYFECPDPAKGVVIGWEPAVLKNPKCFR